MRNKNLFLLISLLQIFMCCKNEYRQGARLYDHYCSSCHMLDGSGLAGLIPPIQSSDYLASHYEELPCIIKYGMFDTITVNGTVYSDIMVGIPDLNEVQISNIMNYIANSFLDEIPLKKYNVNQIDSILQSCQLPFNQTTQ